MTFCAGCDRDVVPAMDIGETGKPMAVCPAGHGILQANPQPDGNAARAMAAKTPIGAATPVTPPLKGAGGVIVRLPDPMQLSRGAGDDPVARMRSELDEINAAIEALEGLQRRRRRIQAALDAFDAQTAIDPDPPAKTRGGTLELPELGPVTITEKSEAAE